MRFETKYTQKETMACQEMETRLEEEEPTSVDTKPKVAQEEEDPKEDAKVMPVGEPKKKRRKERKMAAERQCQRKERAQNQVEYWKLLAVACRGTSQRVKEAWQTMETVRKMPSCPRIAWCKRSVGRRNHTRAMIEPATQRVGPLKDLWMHHRGTKERHGKQLLHGRKKGTTMDGIHKWSLREQTLLGSRGTLRKIVYETYGLKNTKQMPKVSSRMQRIMDWTLWRG
jgi:hypothetical protein